MPQSAYGWTRVWDDFLGPDNDLTWGTGTVKVGNFGFVSVDEGTYEWTIDCCQSAEVGHFETREDYCYEECRASSLRVLL